MVVFVESSCIPEKVVVFGQKCLNSGNSGCIRAEVVVFGQKCLYSGNVVVVKAGQSKDNISYII